MAASSNQLRVLCERRLEDLNLVVLMIDGIHFDGQVLVVALGIAESGEKHVLGVWQGATENTAVVKGLLEDLVDRGLDRQRRCGLHRLAAETVLCRIPLVPFNVALRSEVPVSWPVSRPPLERRSLRRAWGVCRRRP